MSVEKDESTQLMEEKNIHMSNFTHLSDDKLIIYKYGKSFAEVYLGGVIEIVAINPFITKVPDPVKQMIEKRNSISQPSVRLREELL